MRWISMFAMLLLCRSVQAAAPAESRLDIIDVFVAYDHSAKEELERAALAPEAFGQEQIDRMNRCLVNSGLAGDFTFRFVGCAAFDVDTRDATLPDILVSLADAGTAVGEWKRVWTARDACGADLFTFVTGGDIKYNQRGLGWTLAGETGTYGLDAQTGRSQLTTRWQRNVANLYCFNVVSLRAISEENDYTLAHEIAHNMGCGHPDDYADWQGIFDFSSAQAFADGLVTVMGYANGARLQVAPVFSSPDVKFEGLVTGDVTHDNVRTLRNTYRFVAGYRVAQNPPSPSPPSSSDDPTGNDGGAEEEILGFTPTGAFAPAKAVAVKIGSPYVGGLFDASGAVLGVLTLKIGKMNAKKQLSKVGGTIVMADGRKFTVKSADAPTGETPRQTVLTVTKLGSLTLTLGANGFAGRLTAVDGQVFLTRTADVMGGLKASPATFQMESVKMLGEMPVIADCLPDGAVVKTVSGKWTFEKAASVKYVKIKGSSPAAFERVIDTSRGKTNVSALKLSYTAKAGTFKGGFTFYADAGTVAKPKLKKVKATVTGVVVDGVGSGVAVVKNTGSWPVSIR